MIEQKRGPQEGKRESISGSKKTRTNFAAEMAGLAGTLDGKGVRGAEKTESELLINR